MAAARTARKPRYFMVGGGGGGGGGVCVVWCVGVEQPMIIEMMSRRERAV
jgi:hypothetical protein